MNVTAELLNIVEQAHSLARILEAATRVIAERLRVDGCSAFLLDERGELFRSTASGADVSGMMLLATSRKVPPVMLVEPE